MSAERKRLEEQSRGVPWRLFGPYLSERQWGTVREDYSADGDAWRYFTHEDAKSRAYRWGEDGLGGLCDDEQRLCLAIGLHNGQDRMLKERLFGLTNEEGNHGEDVKEAYYYLDATPTASYLKFLYKYPQRAFPYDELVTANRQRGLEDTELELTETDVFDGDRYFDVYVEHAKAAPRDIHVVVTVVNRADRAAPIDVLLQLWFRNTWSWTEGAARPRIERENASLIATHESLGRYRLSSSDHAELLFTENDTNAPRLFGVEPVPGARYKDAFHDYVCRDAPLAKSDHGTKAAMRFTHVVPAHGTIRIRARLAHESEPTSDAEATLDARRNDADAFYAPLGASLASDDARRVQRQAYAGLVFSQQWYRYDVRTWLSGDPAQPRPPERFRNADWPHLDNADVLSMPDKWEYPWYAAWDLAFHCIPIARIDPELAKAQLVLLTREWYMHPNGQLPAYEWNFSDVNPPVHAWAAYRVYEIDRAHTGKADVAFLERVFHKLMLNFTWWVNRKDVRGRNIFRGGFLGLDNIGVFDRSKPLPTGGQLDQADGTSWMAMYSLDLLRIALELAQHNPVYEDIATKFFEHFLYIAEAMNDLAGKGIGLWDDDDCFFYDELSLPDGSLVPLKVRSMVGLIPLFAVDVVTPELLSRVPAFAERLEWLFANRSELAALVSRWSEPGRGDTRLLALLRGRRMKRVLRRMLDESEFFSPYGIRALSKRHEHEPYVFEHGTTRLSVTYRAGESDSRQFGGNSNWRGPIWFPVNYLLIDALRRFHRYYGDDFRVECPTGSGNKLSLSEIADEIARRLASIFLEDHRGERPVFGHDVRLRRDPHFRDHVLFYEYFDGDSGRGIGASHQTGWTALVTELLPRAR